MAPPAIATFSSSPERGATPAVYHEIDRDQSVISDADIQKQLRSRISGNNSPYEATPNDELLKNTAEEILGTTNGSLPGSFTLASSSIPSAAASLLRNRVSLSAALGEPVSASPAPSASRLAANERSVRVDKEIASLKQAVDDASPDALHQLLRQEWRAFLYTPLDEEHLTYILRACLKNATPDVIERGLKEILSKEQFRSTVIESALSHVTTDQLIKQLPTKTLSETIDKTMIHATASSLLRRLPKTVLDQILAHQLDNLPARELVNLLAGAGRLGYTMEDTIDEATEIVSPPDNRPIQTFQPPRLAQTNDMMTGVQYHIPQQQASSYHPAIRVSDHLLEVQNRNAAAKRAAEATAAAEMQRSKQAFLDRRRQNGTIVPPPPLPSPAIATTVSKVPKDKKKATALNQVLGPCEICGFTAPSRGGQAYHAFKKPCTDTSKTPGPKGWTFSCENCGQNFTQSAGYSYHRTNQVCSSRQYADPAPGLAVPQRPPLNSPSLPASQAAPPPAQIHHPHSAEKIPRPPLHTPTQSISTPPRATDAQASIKAGDPKIRVNPSFLSPEKRDELDAELVAEDARYQNLLVAIENNADLTPTQKEQKKTSQKNINGSKKSMIRKKFGVSLRLREADRAAAANLSSPAANFSSPAAPSSSSKAVPSSTPNVSKPPVGFSPINGPSPPNTNATHAPAPILPPGHHVPPKYHTAYAQPPANSNNRRPDPRMSGFGAFETGTILSPSNEQAHPSKRQRTSSDDSARWIPSSHAAPAGLSMMELSSQDASARYPRKVPTSAAQAKWEALQSSQAAPSSSAHPRVSSSNTKPEAIEIDSSSDEADGMSKRGMKVLDQLMDRDLPLPSTEDTESESRPVSAGSVRSVRSGFTARRGGRIS